MRRPCRSLLQMFLMVGGLALAPFAAAQPVVIGPADPADPIPVPIARCACFDLNDQASSVSLTLFIGGFQSSLDGTICLRLGDRPAPAPGLLRVRVVSADFLANDCSSDQLFPPCPLVLTLDPAFRSAGVYNPFTNQIRFDLFLTNPDGGLPVPMPVHLSGTLAGGDLRVEGSNGDIPDGTIELTIAAALSPVREEIFFSTEIGFTIPGPTPLAPVRHVSDGDLLSDRRCIIATNNELTARLGFKPIVPDLGLDAVANAGRRVVYFSMEEDQFSETLGRLITDGDLVSSDGRLVRTNLQLVSAFQPIAIPVGGFGLDGLDLRRRISPDAPGLGGTWLFSTEVPFFSGALGRVVSDGDILSESGAVYRTNAQLLANFNPECFVDPCPDFGLDDFVVLPSGEIWFSVEQGFFDLVLGPISDGDLLSDRGSIVRTNLQLLNFCGPLEDLNNFGLDSVDVRRRPSPCLTPSDPADISADEATPGEDIAPVAGGSRR